VNSCTLRADGVGVAQLLIVRIDRFAFYDRARKAFAVVMTGETAKYGNILLVKGVTPV
jgi:L-fucose mutarotase